MALRPWCERMGIDTHAPLSIAAIMAAGVFSGWLLYRCVETPFMRLRARWYPANRLQSAVVREPAAVAAAVAADIT
jgi:peptidoglycan/LPS O-acetylase OafA/YrhL